MVFMIIIPITNGYFIGDIPYFQTNPYDIWVCLKMVFQEWCHGGHMTIFHGDFWGSPFLTSDFTGRLETEMRPGKNAGRNEGPYHREITQRIWRFAKMSVAKMQQHWGDFLSFFWCFFEKKSNGGLSKMIN